MRRNAQGVRQMQAMQRRSKSGDVAELRKRADIHEAFLSLRQAVDSRRRWRYIPISD
jgi:hypothetical protein